MRFLLEMQHKVALNRPSPAQALDVQRMRPDRLQIAAEG